MYVSQLFKKCLRLRRTDLRYRWYVLSAKHHLLHPDTVIEPYDMRP